MDKSKRGTYTLKELDGAVHAERYAAFRIIPYITRTNPQFHQLLQPSDNDFYPNPTSETDNDESDHNNPNIDDHNEDDNDDFAHEYESESDLST